VFQHILSLVPIIPILGKIQFPPQVFASPFATLRVSLPLESSDMNTQTTLSIVVQKSLSFIKKYGNIISIVALMTLLILTTIFTAIPYIFKKLPLLQNNIGTSEVLQVDGAIIAGALVLLTLTTTSVTGIGISRSQITLSRRISFFHLQFLQ
jgi:hypothetical protein